MIISQKDTQIEFMTTEIVKITTQFQSEKTDLKNEIVDLKRQKNNFMPKLDGFETILRNVESSNNRLEVSLQSFISKSQEKTVVDYIEQYLPTIATIGVLLFNDNKDKINEKVKELKEQLKPTDSVLDDIEK